MERLKRIPELKIKKEFSLPDGTDIAIRSVKASVLISNMREKNLSDREIGMRIMAAKILVRLPDDKEYREIVYEDLVDCFNDEEMTIISKKVNEEDGEKND